MATDQPLGYVAKEFLSFVLEFSHVHALTSLAKFPILVTLL